MYVCVYTYVYIYIYTYIYIYNANNNGHSNSNSNNIDRLLVWGFHAFPPPGDTFRSEPRPTVVEMDYRTFHFHAVAAGGPRPSRPNTTTNDNNNDNNNNNNDNNDNNDDNNDKPRPRCLSLAAARGCRRGLGGAGRCEGSRVATVAT